MRVGKRVGKWWKSESRFWKIFSIALLAVVAFIVVFDLVAGVIYGYGERRFEAEAREAMEAGYDESYRICTRKEDVFLQGKEYLHFQAYLPMILDGAYKEDILTEKEDVFLDKAPGRETDLIVFAKEVSWYDDLHGTQYTIVDIYSVCKDYRGSDELVWDAIGVTLLGVPVAVLLAAVYVIHILVKIWKKRRGKNEYS